MIPVDRRCEFEVARHKFCSHMSRRGRLYCRPHLSTMLARAKGNGTRELKVLFQDAYVRPMRRQIPKVGVRFLRPNEENVRCFLTPVTLDARHGFIYPGEP